MKSININDVDEEIPNDYIKRLARVDNIYLGSKISSTEAVDFLKELNVKTFIDLKSPEKREFAEREVVESRGMLYLNLPVEKVDDINFDFLDRILSQVDDKKQNIFVYCSSGIWATSWLALHLSKICGYSKDKALTLAQKVGLSKKEVEEDLRSRLGG